LSVGLFNMILMLVKDVLIPFLCRMLYAFQNRRNVRKAILKHFKRMNASPFRIIILGFGAVIVFGTFLLMLPVSAGTGEWTSFTTALFTSTSAVCVTGLVVRDTALYWSQFGHVVIIILIQIGGLGIISVTAFLATISGRKISLLQRSLLQESISAHQVGGIVKMTRFIFKVAFISELIGAALLMPTFCRDYGVSGVGMSFFHSVSAFCNAGFDLMGDKTGEFSSLTSYAGNIYVLLPIILLIVFGGIGFLTWSDFAIHRFSFGKYKMQSKVILITTCILILIPSALFFFTDFTEYPLQERICMSLFHAVTPRTAGFNTVDISTMTGAGKVMTIILMLIGGAPGSTAGGIKVTTLAVLVANAVSIVRNRKSPRMFGRRVEDSIVKTAATLLITYVFMSVVGAVVINIADGFPIEACIFETVSAIGTVGLTTGITPLLGTVSQSVITLLMFLGRVGGLTFLLAAMNEQSTDVSRYPIEKINVG